MRAASADRLVSPSRSGAPNARRPWIRGLVVVVVIIALACTPLFASSVVLSDAALVLLYIAASSGLNLALGYAGEFLLSQATTLGVAAYTAGVLSLKLGWSPWAALPVALVAAIVWQVIISLPGLRVRGLYLGLITFFSVLVFSDLVTLTKGWTGGGDGLIGIAPLAPYGSVAGAVEPFEIAIGIAVVSVGLCALITRSGWGLRWKALRDAPTVLGAVGVSASRTKLVAYVASAIPAALAGWLLPYIDSSLTASIFGLSLTLVLFAGVQMIAPGTLWGPVVGVVLLQGYSQFVNPFSSYNVLGLGLLLTIVTILFPRGIANISAIRRLLRGRRDRLALVEEPHPETAGLGYLRVATGVERAMGEGEVLRVTEVAKSFGGNQAVRGVSFDLQSGRLLALMGENGSGKTTLLNMITGLVRPSGGSIVLLGEDTLGKSAAAIADLGCSRTFQVPQLLLESSALENVEVGLLHRMPSSLLLSVFAPWASRRVDRRRRSRAAELCALIGLDRPTADRPVSELPLGLRRLVEIGRAVATDAQLICLDEPSVGLNESELDELAAVLRALCARGHSILLVEHNVQFVLKVADQIMLMKSGSIDAHFTEVDPESLPPQLAHYVRDTSIGAGRA